MISTAALGFVMSRIRTFLLPQHANTDFDCSPALSGIPSFLVCAWWGTSSEHVSETLKSAIGSRKNLNGWTCLALCPISVPMITMYPVSVPATMYCSLYHECTRILP